MICPKAHKRPLSWVRQVTITSDYHCSGNFCSTRSIKVQGKTAESVPTQSWLLAGSSRGIQDVLKLFCYQLAPLLPPQPYRHYPSPACSTDTSLDHVLHGDRNTKWQTCHCPTPLRGSWYPEHSAQCHLPNPCHKKYFCNEWGSEGGSEGICCFMQHFLYVYLANRGKLFLFC